MIFLTLIALSIFSNSSFANIDLLALHTSLKDAHTNQLKYKDSKKFVFNTVDNIQGVVCSAYTPLECKTYDQKSFGFKLNTEHTWPQSKGSKHFPAQGDLHHLYAASKESNSRRQNFPFCRVYQSSWEKQGSKVGLDETFRTCFEPVNEHKGNVARAMFYFSVRYKRNLAPNQEQIFREWNKLDPVDKNERLRNDKIQKIQGNRNPFIDNEYLTEQVTQFIFKKK
jgi:endonuclease I